MMNTWEMYNKEHVNTVGENSELAIDNAELEEHLEQAYLEPSAEIQLRRSTKNR